MTQYARVLWIFAAAAFLSVPAQAGGMADCLETIASMSGERAGAVMQGGSDCGGASAAVGGTGERGGARLSLSPAVSAAARPVGEKKDQERYDPFDAPSNGRDADYRDFKKYTVDGFMNAGSLGEALWRWVVSPPASSYHLAKAWGGKFDNPLAVAAAGTAGAVLGLMSGVAMWALDPLFAFGAIIITLLH